MFKITDSSVEPVEKIVNKYLPTANIKVTDSNASYVHIAAKDTAGNWSDVLTI
jgi:hypothetical protein